MTHESAWLMVGRLDACVYSRASSSHAEMNDYYPLQVAAEQGFRDVLLEQLVRVLAPQQGRDPGQQSLLQAGPSDNLCSTAGRLLLPKTICLLPLVQTMHAPALTPECKASNTAFFHHAGGTATRSLSASSPEAVRRQLSASGSAATGSTMLHTSTSLDGQLPGVPRLNLPPGALAVPVVGLTRSSRRAGSSWNSPAPSPKPSPAPFFLGQSRYLVINS
jgi:hypothetical protein